jgi:hypothetical protein
MPVERVTKELLERELTSQRFLAGLEKAIEISVDTKREACFDVEKELFGEQIVYPSVIHIGDETHCGELHALSYALSRYRKSLEAAGRKWIEPRSPEFDTVDFYAFCAVNRLLHENYPEFPKECSQKKDSIWDFYTFLMLHTHPSTYRSSTHPNPYLLPSFDDLTTLNSFRRELKHLGIYPKPVMVIASIENNDRYQELLFLQEKVKRPIKGKKLKELIKEVDEFLDPKVQLIKGILGVKEKQYCNKGIGYFDRSNGEISFDFDLEDFAYSVEAGGKDE